MSRKKTKRAKPTRLRFIALGTAILLLAGGGAALMVMTSGAPPPSQAGIRIALPPPPKPGPAASSLAAAPVISPVIRAPAMQPAALAPATAPPAAPRPSTADVPAWRRHAVAAPAQDGRPMIAVVIDDLGVDRRRSARAVALPGPLTLAWLPYAADVGQQAAAGKAAGHETLLHAPMQPLGSENPGPYALTVDLPPDELRRRVAAYLALLPDAVGLNNHMGSQFTRSSRAMTPVVDELKSRGLLFLDSLTSGGSIGAEMARAAGVPYAVRDVFLDNELDAGYVRDRLADAEAIARRHGVAVAIGHPHDVTLDVLGPWLSGLAARGLVLVPISAVVRFRLEHPELAVRH